MAKGREKLYYNKHFKMVANAERKTMMEAVELSSEEDQEYGEDNTWVKLRDINYSAPFHIDTTQMSIYRIVAEVAKELENIIAEAIDGTGYDGKQVSVTFEYDPVSYNATIAFNALPTMGQVENNLLEHSVRIQFYVGGEIFGVENGYSITLQPNQNHKFTNVWDRSNIFVHASFVNGTSFQYLGRNGDFFPKPSKMWSFTGNSTEFVIYLSQDGKRPIDVAYVSFIVELTFIYSNSEYQSE